MKGALQVRIMAAGTCFVSCSTQNPMAAAKRNFASRYFRSHDQGAPRVRRTSMCNGSPNMDWPWPRSGKPDESYRFHNGSSKSLKTARLCTTEDGQEYHIIAPRSDPFSSSVSTSL